MCTQPEQERCAFQTEAPRGGLWSLVVHRRHEPCLLSEWVPLQPASSGQPHLYRTAREDKTPTTWGEVRNRFFPKHASRGAHDENRGFWSDSMIDASLEGCTLFFLYFAVEEISCESRRKGGRVLSRVFFGIFLIEPCTPCRARLRPPFPLSKQNSLSAQLPDMPLLGVGTVLRLR